MDLRLNSQCTQRSAGRNFKKLQNGGFLEHLLSVETMLAIMSTNFVLAADESFYLTRSL